MTLPRNCALLDAPVLCRYILKLLPMPTVAEHDDSGIESGGTPSKENDTFYVGQLTRNRLAAVADCLTYLRYVNQGLVKSAPNDVYWEVMRLRRQMGLARLGFMPE